MNTKSRRISIFLPWLSLPLLLGSYAMLWSRLPDQLAVQFDFSGGVANSIGRTSSLLLDTAILLFVLGQFTLRLWGANGHDTRAVMLTYYVAIIFITTVFLAILKFNL